MTQATTWGAMTAGANPTATPTEVKARDAELFNALLSSHSGASRPTYAVAGTVWLDSDDGRLYQYDGAADTELVQRVAVPASAAATGVPGQIAYDASNFYLCTATDTWVRVAVATW